LRILQGSFRFSNHGACLRPFGQDVAITDGNEQLSFFYGITRFYFYGGNEAHHARAD
jgi:hypothetical protein